MGATQIWIVEHDCGDYYCEQNHIAAIATSEEECKRLYAEMLELKTTHRYHDGTEREVDAFPSYCLGMRGPLTIGEVIAPYEAVKVHPKPSEFERMLVRLMPTAAMRAPLVSSALENFNVPKVVTTDG